MSRHRAKRLSMLIRQVRCEAEQVAGMLQRGEQTTRELITLAGLLDNVAEVLRHYVHATQPTHEALSETSQREQRSPRLSDTDHRPSELSAGRPPANVIDLDSRRGSR